MYFRPQGLHFMEKKSNMIVSSQRLPVHGFQGALKKKGSLLSIVMRTESLEPL